MDEYRINSQGFSVGRWYFPPFAVGTGASVSLVLPTQAVVSLKEYEDIVASLTGSVVVPGLTLRATVVWAEPAMNSSGWWQWSWDRTTFAWMKKHAALSDDEISAYLNKHQIDPWKSLNRYALTPRMILGLAAAYSRKPGVILFSTEGLDPHGVRDTFQVVLEHLPECSAICVATHFFRQGQLRHDQLPGSLSVSILNQDELPSNQGLRTNAGTPRIEQSA